MSKLKGKKTKSSDPFHVTTRKTERTAVALLMHWMRNLIDSENIELGLPDVETTADDRKMPDTIIYQSPGSKKALLVLEAKPPYYDIFDEKELKEPAREKATTRKAKYFAVTNFKRLIWYNTEKVNALLPEEEQIVEKYYLSELENLDDIELTRYSAPIKKELKNFLRKLYSVYTKKEPEPKQAIDDWLIFRLHEKIQILAAYYRSIIEDKSHKDVAFADKLVNWFLEQGWSFAWSPSDFDKAARQTAYLLINKILFYNLLQAKRPQELPTLKIDDDIIKGSVLQDFLKVYFEQVLKIDYETIYTTDFIDTIAFPEAKEVVYEIKELINILKQYDFSKIRVDIIGGIFEKLIPQQERHNLGQYFTSTDVVDLILKFCLHHENDKVLDPGCGAGTFLVRAYQHKELMNQRLAHEDILDTLWGVDIAKFPAHLSTINLAINDLGVDKNYPNILNEDFFALLVGEDGFDPEKWRRARAKTLGLEERELIYPRWFNAVVGNPPYTRQEEIQEIGVDKIKLIESALKDLSGKEIARISKRAGIHAYFFVHGTKFLLNDGYFGFIVSNSWMDVDYGKGLQEFFLKKYKIIAILESKVERWFEEADINTCIIILQKCSSKKERDNNLVRFVYLKKPLRHFIPPAQDIWEKQIDRLNAIDKLKKTILAHSEIYENDELRIFPKSQKELWDEGYDEVKEEFTGAKWGKYLRAPEIFFRIMEKGKFVPLKDIADVRFGIKTGANEFFYLTEEEIKRRGIEREFWMHKDEKGQWVPNYVIKSPRECKSIVVNPDDLKYRVLMIHKGKDKLEGTNVLKYIKAGERKGYNERPTCASRGEKWYSLPMVRTIILSKRFVDIAFGYLYNPHNIFVGDTFFAISIKNKANILKTLAMLNSTLGSLFTEIYGRTVMGEGVLLIYGPEIVPMPIIKPNLIKFGRKYNIKKILTKPIESIFSELGASTPEDASLEKVKPDRRELDKIIMEDILGLSEEEQIEVYRAVVDLVRSRIEKAKSFKKRRKAKEEVEIESIKKEIIKRVEEE